MDCLMGTMNAVIHPVPIHTMMETGLCIHESKLMSHNGVTNAIIGGPHESFEFLVNLAGGEV